jgi:Skp family chaperone for outer membrane proteins
MWKPLCFQALILLGLSPAAGASPLSSKGGALPSVAGDFAATRPQKIGSVDMDKLLHESKAALSIQGQAEKKHDALQKEVESFEKKLRDEEAVLRKHQELKDLAPEEFRQKQTQFEERVTEVQTNLNQRTKILTDVFSTARSDLLQTVLKVITQVAQEKGYTEILPKNVFLINDPEHDITKEVMDLLNGRLPQITIEIPKGA